MPGNPFGVVVTRDGQWGFVSLGASVGVVRIGASLAPSLVTTIGVSGEPAGEALTPDGRYLLVASDSGAIVISVARAEQRSPDAVVGTLGTGSRVRFAGGAIEVALSPSGEFAFVTLESSGEMAVFNLARALAHGFGPDDYVGAVRLGMAPVGMAVSPDGRWLYATSELRSGGTAPEPGGGGTGTLTVIGLRRAETQPGRSVVATVNAGCEPVRVVTSAYGDDVWVTARGSDALLCFSAAALRDDPARSLIAKVRVGVAPVGLALAGDGSRIVVADSNRFGVDGATASLAVVNVADALAGKPALTGYISAGMFPRQFALEPDGRVLLVTNYLSRQLEAVPLAAVP
jgi:DNA-binding beta-propeller fold protein YncE